MIISACGSLKTLSEKKENNPSLQISAQAGINHRGIAENRNMNIVTNAEVDVFTGATRPGYNIGVHANNQFLKFF